MSHPWPLFDLRIRTPRLELRVPTDDDLVTLAGVARAGTHDRAVSPFLVPWDALPSPGMERQFLLHWWKMRGAWSPQDWTLGLAVLAGGQPIGMQDVTGRDFARRRVVLTGSWLGLAHQGRGFGTEMRAAVLHLAFAELGALVAESGYVEGNAAAARVAEKLGYTPNGTRIYAHGETRRAEQMVRVTPEAWQRDLVPVTVEGLDACRGLFGEQDLPAGAWATL
jgi:RimJ/RimL family protein N-acetyltransferase